MRKTIAIAAVCAVLTLLHSNFASTNAVFAQSRTSTDNQFAGATFSPAVAPVVSLVSNGNSITLTWSRVTISSGAAVSYEVLRTPVTGAAVAVCTGVDTPTQTGSNMTCTDSTAVSGAAYTYTEQPILFVGAVATWSLAASASSASACVKKCK